MRKAVPVYRLSDRTQARRPHYFNWWSFDQPQGSAALYRAKNVMCSGWPVEMMTVCRLKTGTRIAVGHGQSDAECDGGIDASPTIQVFVAGDSAEIQQQMEDGCTTGPGLLEP